MRIFIAAIMLLAASESFSADFFVSLKVGGTLRDSDTFETASQTFDADYGHPLRITVSAGIRPRWCRRFGCKVGISHESSPLSGAPFNERYDYAIDQAFAVIEYYF